MPVWEWLLDTAGLLLVLVIGYGAGLVARRWLLSRHGGTFELSHRVWAGRAGRGWVLGLGRYSGETLEWFRIFTLSPRPKQTWKRSDLVYRGQPEVQRDEQHALYPGHVVIVCDTSRGEIDLAMSPASLTGFQAWLEAGPPGTDWSR